MPGVGGERVELDDIDIDLVRLLIADGRLSYQELAGQVNLSPSSTGERVRRLVRLGVIAGFHADLDLRILGRTLHAITDLKLKDDVERWDFEEAVRSIPEVLTATHTTGEYDYQLSVVAADPANLEAVIDMLRRIGAREAQSRIVLGEARFDPARLLKSRPEA